jgi:thiamine-phosphate pyrophosphorylase
LRLAGCLITSRLRLRQPDAAGVIAQVERAVDAGIDLVQVRERDLEGRALYDLVRGCLAVAHGTHTRVLVNDRLDVAIAAGAHGVHLRGRSLPAARARALAGTGFLIGRSVHSADEAIEAWRAGGLDYLMFGNVFDTASKPGREAAGLERLAEVAHATPLPVLAVGGITAARAPLVARAGASGFAAISMFT